MVGKRKASTSEDTGQTNKRKRTQKSSGPRKQLHAKEAPKKHPDQDNFRGEQEKQQQQQQPLTSTTRSLTVKQDLLERCFPWVETLRAYLLTRLPSSSRLRRKKLVSVGKNPEANAVEQLLSHVLDTTLVACAENGQDNDGPVIDHDRETLRQTFSQTKQADESYVTVSSAAEGVFSPQAEIVDFVVWLLFSRAKKTGSKGFGLPYPSNVLCHGYKRGPKPQYLHETAEMPGAGPDPFPASTIPGLCTTRNPQHAQTLKEAPWPQLLAILGASAEKIMTDLLLDCSLFIRVDAGFGNYIQLTGKPLFDILSAKTEEQGQGHEDRANKAVSKARPPSDIVFARSHMLYCRPTLTTGNKVHFGLSPKHVLNKLTDTKAAKNAAKPEKSNCVVKRKNTIHLTMHIFPREFGLRNVFTSPAERGDLASQRLIDYSLREKEIVTRLNKPNGRDKDSKILVPKRLRTDALALVGDMQTRHNKCAYLPLLNHYCPSGPANEDAMNPDETASAPANSTPFVELATPLPQVSAFCRAVIQKVIPDKFWGIGDAGSHNRKTFLRHVDMFIRLQRFESVNLHSVLQGLKIAEIKWLQPPKLKYDKMSQTDAQKRQTIFAEFVYFLFDAYLIPLIASNFYVTESSAHRNRLFYFRHDVWRRISEPALASLVSTRLEPVELKEAVRLIESRGLGYGKLRLLPKKAAMRPIVNLRRVVPKKGDAWTAPSINSVLRPVAAMLKLEMKEHPERLGSGMLSIHSIYPRLKGFRDRMYVKNRHVFYFAKVDVQSAFDTIPQKAMVRLLGTVPESPFYNINHHVEIAPTGADLGRRLMSDTSAGPVVPPKRDTAAAPRQVWRTVAKAGDDATGFHDAVEASIAQNKRNTVFVDSAFVKTHHAEALARLAATHIQDNIVRVGDKYYRQKEGIPQGSVLSSTLCSYFYADLEEKELGFLKSSAGAEDEDCLLLRLIDDFLVISTNRDKAARFVEVMQRGHPAYGVAVNPSKSLVNFALEIDGKPVPRLTAGQPFPYCGTFIHCTSLNLTKDRDNKAQPVFNSITVERLRLQGYHFKRKIFNYFQIQSHHMFFDTSFNSRRTALLNLHAAFAETANKMWAYARCMPKAKRPSAPLTIRTIIEVGVMALGILNGKRRTRQSPTYEFSVPTAHVRYLLFHAFYVVLGKKQTGYKDVLEWLRSSMRQLREQGRLRLPPKYMLKGL